MKKLFVAAGLAGLVSAGLVLPAHAEATTAAPTNVQIRWKDDTYQFVHVTWDEAAGLPNRIILRRPGSTSTNGFKYVAADAPNEIDLPKASIWPVGSKLEIGVGVGTAMEPISPLAVSVPFDTIGAGSPVIEGFKPTGTSTLQVTWKAGTPVEADTTPGDPLDVDYPATYVPMYRTSDATPLVPIGQPTSSTTITFTDPKPPYSFLVRSRNEWLDQSSTSIIASSSAFTTSIPSWVVADHETVIRGTFDGPEDGSTSVTLQARDSVTSAWYAVATNYFQKSYQFSVPSRGTRQYRVVVGNATGSYLRVWFGGFSAPVTTTTQLKATVAMSATAVYRSNQLVNAWLYVNPASNGAAVQQRWNGKTWIAVANVAFKAGQGTAHLSAATAGTFTYRFYVPAQTFKGLPVAAAYSPNFTLKVKP
jgi:hypothetical protein